MTTQIQKPRTKQKIRIFWAMVFIVGLVSLSGISALTWSKIDPISFRQLAFVPMRDCLYFYQEIQPITGLRQLRTQPDFKNQRVEIPAKQPGDLTVMADLWKPDKRKGLHPALLILHGSTPQGRHNSLVRMLAHHFQQLGWVVLTPDARGYGESEDPPNIHDPQSWRSVGDISRCVDYLYRIMEVDKQRIFVLGHSMGAASALGGALDDPRVKALILIGPPRIKSGSLDQGAEAQHINWRVRFSADRNLSEVISEKVWIDTIGIGDIALYAREGRLLETTKPILILDGELEKEADHQLLQEVSRRLSASSKYYTIPGVGHYCGVYHIPGTDFIIWRQDLFETSTAQIMAFIEGPIISNSRRK
jgi:pimeloyl-ACP methyl ester carboxylesterase